MELLGKSLEDILNTIPSKTFSIQSTCNLAVQMLIILEDIHNKHIIHRDIKPDNFVMGSDSKKDVVYLLDFGLAKKYRSSRTLQHSPMVKNRKLTGTARYASINALIGVEQSRRDDLESLGYVLMYFLRGSLPWQGLPVRNHEDRYMKIMEKKRDTSSYELCKNFPSQFETFVEYTRKLGYEEDPKYEWMKNLFEQVVRSLNYTGIDRTFDWIQPITTQSMTSHVDDGKSKIIVINNYHNIVINGANGDISGNALQQNKQLIHQEDLTKTLNTPKNSQCNLSNIHSGKNVLLINSGQAEPSTRNSNVCVNGNDAGAFVSSVNADVSNATFIINKEEMPKEEFDIEIKNDVAEHRCHSCVCVIY
jgi:serine/threonine protein kinase